MIYSISHSSYNSANENLEFDLYDYEQDDIICDDHEDYSMSELVPIKLFPSNETVVNIEHEENDFIPMIPGTEVHMDSTTSDITSSTFTDRFLPGQDTLRLEDIENFNQNDNGNDDEKEEESSEHKYNEKDLFCNRQNIGILNDLQIENHNNMAYIEEFEDDHTQNTILSNTIHSESDVPDNYTSYFSFPPMTLIDDLENWDE